MVQTRKLYAIWTGFGFVTVHLALGFPMLTGYFDDILGDAAGYATARRVSDLLLFLLDVLLWGAQVLALIAYYSQRRVRGGAS